MTALATGSWAKDARNSRFLPSVGSLTRVSGEIAIPGGDLTYYKLFGQHQRFFPLARDFVLVLEAEVGYGDGFGDTRRLPLTDNFFGGGLRSVRGFRANTLGPRDSLNEPLGGNLKVVGTAEVILPLRLRRTRPRPGSPASSTSETSTTRKGISSPFGIPRGSPWSGFHPSVRSP